MTHIIKVDVGDNDFSYNTGVALKQIYDEAVKGNKHMLDYPQAEGRTMSDLMSELVTSGKLAHMLQRLTILTLLGSQAMTGINSLHDPTHAEHTDRVPHMDDLVAHLRNLDAYLDFADCITMPSDHSFMQDDCNGETVWLNTRTGKWGYI